ncbi:MAG: HAMP domain-containing sensor histidine kinase [Candidatus Krumholzibacteria bacterium]|nr:HAMP domain-containing sensor histidine kinase [Candidatus Krumholzibacteria bacterium]
MRLIRSIGLFLAVAALALVIVVLNMKPRQAETSRFGASYLPFRLENVVSVHTAPKLPFFVADVDLDGNDDLLVNETGRFLWYRLHESRMTLAGAVEYKRSGCTRMVADANGDVHPDFFVLTGTPEGPMLSCYDWLSPNGASVPLYTIGPLIPPPVDGGEGWRRINLLGSFAGDVGAHPQVYIGLNSMKMDDTPRWLLSFDGVTGQELWRFCFGPRSLELVCDDFGGNTPRVVFTTIATRSGISCNGIPDSLSCVFCLDGRNGSLLWKQPVAGMAGRGYVGIADINGDSRDEVLVARYVTNRDSTVLGTPRNWAVEALSRDGAVLFAVPLPTRPEFIRAADLDGDSSLEVVVEGIDGKIIILERNLTIGRIVKPLVVADFVQYSMYGVWNLEDGKPNLVCRMDSILLVRDLRGNVIAGQVFDPTIEPQLMRCDGRSHLVLAQEDSIHVMTLKRSPFGSRLRAHSLRLTIGAAAVLIAVWIGFHMRRQPRRRRERRIDFDRDQNELLTAMSAFGHGGSSLKILDRLRLHLKNWERIRSDGVTREELFARLRQTYGETVAPELEHLVMLARKAGVPEGSWNTLLAEADLAGEEMEGVLVPGSEGAARRDEHIAKALAALESVDASIAGIRSHLRSVFRTPVAEALERLIARFRHEHGAGEISFALAADSSASAAVFISPVSFDKIFETLLSNAGRATEGKTGAEIGIAVRWEGNYCQIDVRDSGCGIPREDWERVFERQYTTKPEGGGFGLHYAREQLAKFGGKIYVLDSAAGSGTTMRVVLRKSEKAGAV